MPSSECGPPLVHLLDPPSQRGRPSREGAYDATAIKAIAEGLRSPAAVSRKTLLVRIPPFHEDAVASAARIKEAFAAGADGVTVPHVQSVDEARQVLQAFAAAKVNVWSPSNRAGEIAMLMIEDPGALGQVKAFADLRGIRILGCDIRRITDAPGGDRQRANKPHKQCLPRPQAGHSVEHDYATSQDVEKRIKGAYYSAGSERRDHDRRICHVDASTPVDGKGLWSH